MNDIIGTLKNIVFAIGKRLIGKWRYFLILSNKRGRNIKKIHYTNCNATEDKFPNGCIFISNGMTPMGGLCDRLKGIVTTYAWCKDNNLPFKILFTDPFPLNNYLKPNTYNWYISEDKVAFSKKRSEVACLLYSFDIADIVDSGEALLKTQEYLDKRLPAAKSKQVHIFSNAQTRLSNKYFSILFNELFVPNSSLQEEMNINRKHLGEHYISISFRFTTLLGDLHDCTGEPLPTEEVEEYISKCLKAIDDIARNSKTHERILITADSRKFLDRVTNPNCYIIPGEVGHIQFDKGNDITLKTFLDLMLIAEADEVYLVRYKKMYNSGFAKTAAMINAIPFHIYTPSVDIQ